MWRTLYEILAFEYPDHAGWHGMWINMGTTFEPMTAWQTMIECRAMPWCSKVVIRRDRVFDAQRRPS